MVGIGPEGLDSAVARVTICNWAEQVILDTFVKVPVEVTDYRTFVSGIEAKHLEGDGAKTLPEVRKIVKEILHGKILIGHALENDLAALQIDHPWHDIRDSANYPPFMKAGESDATVLRPRKLKELVRDYLGRDIQNLGVAHDPIEDAIAALSLYKSVRLDWEKLVMMQVASARVKETRETEPTSKKNNHASRYRPKKQTTRMEHATYSRSRSAPTTTGMTYYRGYGHHSYHPQQNYLY
jgi:RNA exonuclease 4